MRYFKIVYEQKNIREVWVEIPEEEIIKEPGEFAGEHVAAREFWADFKRYDDESDECGNAENGADILSIDEIDEHGDEI